MTGGVALIQGNKVMAAEIYDNVLHRTMILEKWAANFELPYTISIIPKI